MPSKGDPNDYMFRKEKGKILFKPPGSLSGNGFLLDRVQDCEVYVCDFTSQVQIDDCINCKIFIGPCDGSVFIRDSVNCSLCVCCRQLRTRDCMDLDISLHCATQPSLETSTGVVISPWRGTYPELEEHMRAAKLDPAENTWDQVYDFSAGEALDGDVQHWKLDCSPRPQWTTPLEEPAAAPAGTAAPTAKGGEATVPEEGLPLPPLQEPQHQDHAALEPSAPSTPPLQAPLQAAAPQALQQHQQQQLSGVASERSNGSAAKEDAREVWLAQNRARLAAQRQAEENTKQRTREKAAEVLRERALVRASKKEARHARIVHETESTQAAFKASQGVSGNGGPEGWSKVMALLRDPATGTIRQVLGAEGPLHRMKHEGAMVGKRALSPSNGAGNGGPTSDLSRMREVLLSLSKQK